MRIFWCQCLGKWHDNARTYDHEWWYPGQLDDLSLTCVYTKHDALRTEVAWQWCQEVGFNLITEKRCLNVKLMQACVRRSGAS